MWTEQDTLDVLSTVFSDTGFLLAQIILGVFAGLIALVGLGYALQKIFDVTGRARVSNW